MQALSPVQAPELIFGLIAPIGVDLGVVSDILAQTLKEMQYDAHSFRLTKLMQEVPDIHLPLDAPTHVDSYKQRIAFANAVRGRLGNEALAALAISALRAFRAEERARRASKSELEVDAKTAPFSDEQDEEAPLPSQAYIVRQLKRPEEIALLRAVYGRQFILVSAYAPETWRQKRIEQQERTSRGGLIDDVEAHRLAHELIVQDAKEAQETHGQRVRDAFPLGDVFIDATSRQACEAALRRFIHLLFGSNEITPTHDEYGMYMAKSASLRSSDLSRQVGAAVFRRSGEVATLGCNEVPKAGGGTYWAEDDVDRRDFIEGHDPNERIKMEVLVDVLDRLRRGGHLSAELAGMGDPVEASKRLLAEKTYHSVADSKIMDLIEFGRVVHAEMSAICDASRSGIPVEGGILYCTTFPCHLCAKLIVAAGLREVVYLEPYPKSYASELHGDSISIDSDDPGHKVRFRAFIGVSPYRYRDLFEKGRRKYQGGTAQRWNRGASRPMIEVYYPQYFKAEALIVGSLGDAMAGGEDASSPADMQLARKVSGDPTLS
jgi:cytidine deaminase